MTKDARKCSHCGHNGHNSRTCNNVKEVKLFGVRIDEYNNMSINNYHQCGDTKIMKMKIGDEIIRRSKSLGNLESAAAVANNDLYNGVDAGYLSDGPRKKGKPWTEEEHRSFLIGLEKLGKGDWRGISKKYVPSRTSTQVASHAQKYFNRISTSNDKKKRRPSVFDVHLNDPNSQISSKALSSSSPTTIPNKVVPEVQKEASASLEQLFDTCQLKVQTSKTAPSSNYEKPPISPMSRPLGVPDFRHIPYVMGSPRNVHSFTAAKVAPTISWIPVINFPNQSQYNGHFMNSQLGANFATNYVTRPSTTGVFSLPAPQVQSTNKDAVNISIGALGV